MTSRKPSWVEFIEKEIEHLDNRIEKDVKRLEKRMDKISLSLMYFISLTRTESELVSRLRFLLTLSKEASTQNVKKNIAMLLEEERNIFEQFRSPKGLEESLQKFFEQWVLDGSKARFPMYIFLAKEKGIAFNDFAALLLKKLGVNLAGDVVLLDELVQYFGIESADAWKKLIKR